MHDFLEWKRASQSNHLLNIRVSQGVLQMLFSMSEGLVLQEQRSANETPQRPWHVATTEAQLALVILLG
jgi:hypothetical protein